MIFEETGLIDAYIVKPEKIKDHRGFFARVWCAREFEAVGLNTRLVQSNVSFSHYRGTLRGMHFQTEPHQEAKLFRCIKGAAYHVIIDLRPESTTYMEWEGVELTEENFKMLWVPKGFAHGYLALKDRSVVFYHVNEFYSPENEKGIRWNDTSFNIQWPHVKNVIISEKDLSWPNFVRE